MVKKLTGNWDQSISNWVHEAVFGFNEAALKLDVTTWGPKQFVCFDFFARV